MKISLVEYDAGNLPSVERALARQGVETERAATPDSIAAARALILPGVGHFGQLMRPLGSRGVFGPVRQAIGRGGPPRGRSLRLEARLGSRACASRGPGLRL